MKIRLFLLCVAVLSPGSVAGARQTDLGRVPARTTTLVSYGRHRDYGKSVFSFKHGKRGERKSRSTVNPRAPSLNGLPGNEGLLRNTLSNGAPQQVQDASDPFRRAGELAPVGAPDSHPLPVARDVRDSPRRLDIRYGGLTWNGTNDWLEVVDYRGTRSVIKDLGAMSWSEVAGVPPLEPAPAPHPNGLHIRNRRIVSPQNVHVRAVPGHMYLLRIEDAKGDNQVLFRVESIDPAGECTLSWKRVPTPKS
ncbi:MAG: hypothetical protein LC795_05520 [Acidobacteria bacterium]|nr:hypothetical protein [Acidobacteriota bacterium]